jgi:hypothetical protein
MPKVNETISIISTDLEAMGKVYVIIESISIQTFRQKIRTLLRIVTEGVSVTEPIAKLLQDGAVRITKTLKIHDRDKSQDIYDRSESEKTHDKDKSVEINDRDKNVKTYKRDKRIKGGS